MPRILAVADVTRVAALDRHEELLALYRDVLGLTPVPAGEGLLVFRGQQATGPKLLIRLVEAPPAPDVQPIPVLVASLLQAEEMLAEREIEVLASQGMWIYDRRLLLQDPAGNWVSLTTSHPL